MSYEKAVITKQGDVTIRIESTNTLAPEWEQPKISRSALVWIDVQATTNEDERIPPIEARPYTIILQLTGVKGVLQDGTVVVLGDYDILFPQSFKFLHLPWQDIPKDVYIPGQGSVIGNGIVPHQKKTGVDNVEGPPAVLDPKLEEPIDLRNINIPAGQNLFHINDAGFDLQLPPNFFGPGSEPFTGTVVCPEENPDTLDTIIERKSDINFPPDGTETIPIEMLELNLVSCQPIVVTLDDGNQQLWDVKIDLSDTEAQPGEMTIERIEESGGTFDAQLPVLPKFTFTQVDGEADPIPCGTFQCETEPVDNKIITFAVVTPYNFQAFDIPWNVCPGTESDFCPDQIPFQADNSWLFLQVQPPLQQAPPDCGRLTCETQPD